MFVSDILSQKGHRVIGISLRVSVAEICRELAHHRIGSLLVHDDENGIAGIVSERDVVHAFSRHGAGALELSARDVMTEHVTTCHPDDTIAEVMAAMTHGRFRHLPVVRAGEIQGIVSIGDVVKARLDEARHETEALRAYIVTG